MTSPTRLSAALFVPLALAAMLLSGCAGDQNQVAGNGLPSTKRAPVTPTGKAGHPPQTTQPPTTASATPPPSGIVIENFKFVDAVAKAHAVTKVVNKDTAPHTLTADDLSFDTKTIDGNATGEFTAPGPGTYKIHCVLHPFMTGTLAVRG
jgi:plastocyanin